MKNSESYIAFHCKTREQLDTVNALAKSFGFGPSEEPLVAPVYVRLNLTGGDRGHNPTEYPVVGLPNLVALLRPAETLPKIGAHAPEIRSHGVQVGCTFVPWETIDAIVAARKKL